MKTKKIFLHQLTPGAVIAEDIYTSNDQLIIPAGTIATPKTISRLRFYAINAVTVGIPEPVAAPQSAVSITQTPEFTGFKTDLQASSKVFKQQLYDLAATKKELDPSDLLKIVEKPLSNCRNSSHVFDIIHNLREFDDLIFYHSLNVALICNVMGHWLGFSESDIETLTLCGLLHDIGKLTISPDIISKTDKLTPDEYDTIKSHSIAGYNLLRSMNYNSHIKMSAMMHHERCDGSGYPMGLHGDQIDSFAKIVAIADVYDAMTSARAYREPICPFEAIRIFESEGLTKYDTHYIMTFLEHINQTYIGADVELNNGIIGKVIMMNRFALSKPIIHVNDTYIDLSKEPDLFIKRIL